MAGFQPWGNVGNDKLGTDGWVRSAFDEFLELRHNTFHFLFHCAFNHQITQLHIYVCSRSLKKGMNNIVFSEDIACDHCGRFEACDFDGRKLCRDCYQTCGSCCPEFGADDLWQDDDESKPSKPNDGRESAPHSV